MNPTAFIEMLNNKNPDEFKDFKQLDKLLKNHPYFQIGLAVKTKYLKTKQHIDYIKTSRKTAVIFPDRSKLYQYLNLTESKIDAPEEKEIKSQISVHEINQDTESEKSNLNSDEISLTKETLITDSDLSELEKNYLAEAINQSIQLDATGYTIADTISSEDKLEEPENEILSFSDWLGGKSKITQQKFESKLIDDFISEDPIITRVQKKEFYSPIEKGKESISDENLPVSETLARIFINQGNKAMAIKSYEKLMLKYPEKSIYFAGLIKKIKEK